MPYSFDTDVFIELKRSSSDNDRLWEILGRRMDSRDILVSREVVVEIQRGTDTLIDRIRTHPRCIVETDNTIQKYVTKLVNKYLGWVNPASTRNLADPYVIAVAGVHHGYVVTLERANQFLLEHPEQWANQTTGLKIPNICEMEHIPHLNSVDYLIATGTFT